MPYTLMKGLVWILLAVLLGLIIGWLLRSVAAKRQIERARSGNAGAGNDAELERLRNRVANLEPVVNERDRLRAELDAERRSVAAPASAPVGSEPTVAAVAGVPAGDPSPTTDLAGAKAALGRSIEQDDLTVVEGVGPKIAELCRGIGITTWAEMSTTEVSLLRTMLADAGARYSTHDPTTWPQQAGLLARREWVEFVALTDRLEGGRVVD